MFTLNLNFLNPTEENIEKHQRKKEKFRIFLHKNRHLDFKVSETKDCIKIISENQKNINKIKKYIKQNFMINKEIKIL